MPASLSVVADREPKMGVVTAPMLMRLRSAMADLTKSFSRASQELLKASDGIGGVSGKTNRQTSSSKSRLFESG